ncbi:MAG: non-canonical purine NTP pyrophosphatase [Chloroflexi bacterium]|nr:XTP/dITP diphosphatase [Anaerolineae bacterium]RLC70029.1 MAG: non-canonical purine NTP pyrophosphatase [Chloroflexota bacterium]
MKLLVATHNPGKVQEYRELLSELPADLVFPAELGLDIRVVESGDSFEENAVLKARAFSQASGFLTLADDSGLEVDALGGAPGVRTARYAGHGASDADRYQLLLHNLEGVPWEARTARFRCVVALATPDGQLHTAEGRCEGVIALAPSGEHGFGYDPVFYMPEYGCTMAELDPAIKNRVSHRARAVQAAWPILEALLKSQQAG